MAILITCIGGSDPIRSYHDGPILNILRYNNNIDKCYLLMSTVVERIHNDVNKDYYRRAFSKLIDRNDSIEYIYISLNIEKANDFDIYFDIFIDKFKEIVKENYNEKIYVNLTSGTPQMQTSLALVSCQFNYGNIYPLQVDNFSLDSKNKTPDSMSDKYNFDEEMTLRQMNNDDYNRCKEVKLYTILKNNILEQIKLLVNKYEYSVILDLYNEYLMQNRELKRMITIQKYRQDMYFSEAVNQLDMAKVNIKDYFPLYNNKNSIHSNKFKLFEYYLQLANLVKNNMFNDFIIRLDLFTVELLKEYINKFSNIRIEKITDKGYFSINKTNNVNPSLANYLKANFTSDFKGRRFNIILLNKIMKFFFNNTNPNVVKFFEKIEKLHYERNTAAHDIDVVTKDEILRIISVDKILEEFKKIIRTIYPDIKESDFDSYDNINKKIISLIK